ncbi:hypothetical protein ACP70R_008811 [Stipagrostis hirtigluma subsp. patula]
MDVATAQTTAAPEPAKMLRLCLSLSPASKVIAKGGRRRPDGAFRCRTCGRGFATFQALGGHRTSHKRPRVRADGLELLLDARPGKGAAAATAVHRCHACGEVFPTGQALGGHMRRHRAPFDAAAPVTVPMTASGFSSEEGDEDDDTKDLLPGTLIKFI